MPQTNEPFYFTNAGTQISGIGEAKSTTSVTLGGASNTAHDLANHPQVAGDWDNVYMPQPMTREKRGTIAGSSGPDGAGGTLDDNFRYWPAHRDKIDGWVRAPVYKTEIGTLSNWSTNGCGRFESVESASSDEGYWDGYAVGMVGSGTNYQYESTHLGLNSPAYQTIYHQSTGTNALLTNPDNWDTDSEYISSFLSTFAKGYDSTFCTKVQVSTFNSTSLDHEDGPDEWGSFTDDANISYGVGYYDDFFGLTCSTCCGSYNNWVQTVGGLWTAYDLTNNSFYMGGSTTTFRAGGLFRIQNADKHAGAQWLSTSGSYTWRESDVRRLTEYSMDEFGYHNPPGKFGIIDNSRTNRQANDLSCLKVGESQIHASGYDGNVDANEKCTYLCNSLGSSFVHEGITYSSTSLTPTS